MLSFLNQLTYGNGYAEGVWSVAAWQNHPETRIRSPLLAGQPAFLFNYSAAGHSAGRREP